MALLVSLIFVICLQLIDSRIMPVKLNGTSYILDLDDNFWQPSAEDSLLDSIVNGNSTNRPFSTSNNSLIPSNTKLPIHFLVPCRNGGLRHPGQKYNPINTLAHKEAGCCPKVGGDYCADGTTGKPFCNMDGVCNSCGCNCGSCRPGWFVTVYPRPNFSGEGVAIIGGSVCQNIVRNFCDNTGKCVELDKRISSIDTHDNCVKVYEDAGCLGDSMTLSPQLYDHCPHSDLRKCDFDKKISSIGPCSE